MIMIIRSAALPFQLVLSLLVVDAVFFTSHVISSFRSDTNSEIASQCNGPLFADLEFDCESHHEAYPQQ